MFLERFYDNVTNNNLTQFQKSFYITVFYFDNLACELCIPSRALDVFCLFKKQTKNPFKYKVFIWKPISSNAMKKFQK